MALVLDDPSTFTPVSPDLDLDQDEFLGLDRPWNVLLWNDDVTPIEIVILALIHIVGLDQQKATDATIYIHQHGKAIVATESREKAELTKEQLEAVQGTYNGKNFKLSASLEQS